jgi:hypothetical protein
MVYRNSSAYPVAMTDRNDSRGDSAPAAGTAGSGVAEAGSGVAGGGVTGAMVAEPAFNDAYQIAERISADEIAAEAARRRYREDGLPELAPDTTMGHLLRPGERLVALREQTVLELFDGKPTPPPVGGRLYLTSERLLHSGTRQLHQIDLTSIDEVGPSGERLLITLRNGDGWSLQLDGPRVLRVAMAELLAARR